MISVRWKFVAITTTLKRTMANLVELAAPFMLSGSNNRFIATANDLFKRISGGELIIERHKRARAHIFPPSMQDQITMQGPPRWISA